jgi:hypothetical protein
MKMTPAGPAVGKWRKIRKGPGHPKSGESQVTKPNKRKMSAKGRAAISAAMKARWAKRATKTVTKKAATKSKS